MILRATSRLKQSAALFFLRGVGEARWAGAFGLQADRHEDVLETIKRGGAQKFIREIEREGGRAGFELFNQGGSIQGRDQAKQIFNVL
jgi:hypothetical protein